MYEIFGIDKVVLYVAHQELVAAHVGKVVVERRLYYLAKTLLAIPVHYHVVGNAHYPCPELAARGVFALLKLGYDFHESLLKNVIGSVAVTHNKQNIREKLRLIARQKQIKRPVVPIDI